MYTYISIAIHHNHEAFDLLHERKLERFVGPGRQGFHETRQVGAQPASTPRLIRSIPLPCTATLPLHGPTGLPVRMEIFVAPAMCKAMSGPGEATG